MKQKKHGHQAVSCVSSTLVLAEWDNHWERKESQIGSTTWTVKSVTRYLIAWEPVAWCTAQFTACYFPGWCSLICKEFGAPMICSAVHPTPNQSQTCDTFYSPGGRFWFGRAAADAGNVILQWLQLNWDIHTTNDSNQTPNNKTESVWIVTLKKIIFMTRTI